MNLNNGHRYPNALRRGGLSCISAPDGYYSDEMTSLTMGTAFDLATMGSRSLASGVRTGLSQLSSSSASWGVKNSRYLNNNNWIRLGKGQLGSAHYIRLSFGANNINNVRKYLQPINRNMRTWFQEGHVYFKNWK